MLKQRHNIASNTCNNMLKHISIKHPGNSVARGDTDTVFSLLGRVDNNNTTNHNNNTNDSNHNSDHNSNHHSNKRTLAGYRPKTTDNPEMCFRH